jgi:hypothetical protein
MFLTTGHWCLTDTDYDLLASLGKKLYYKAN